MGQCLVHGQPIVLAAVEGRRMAQERKELPLSEVMKYDDGQAELCVSFP